METEIENMGAEDVTRELAEIKRKEEELIERARTIAKMRNTPKKMMAFEDLKESIDGIHNRIAKLEAYSLVLGEIRTEVGKMDTIIAKTDSIETQLKDFMNSYLGIDSTKGKQDVSEATKITPKKPGLMEAIKRFYGIKSKEERQEEARKEKARKVYQDRMEI